MKELAVRPPGNEVEHAQVVPMRYGLKLRVLRHEGSKDRSGGGISYRNNHLMLVGTVRYPESEAIDLDNYRPDDVGVQKPLVEPLAPTFRTDEVGEHDNLVWLVENRYGDGQFFLVPENPNTHEPVSLEHLRFGGNYADGIGLQYQLVVKNYTGAIPIHDKLVSRANPYGVNE